MPLANTARFADQLHEMALLVLYIHTLPILDMHMREKPKIKLKHIPVYALGCAGDPWLPLKAEGDNPPGGNLR